MSKKTLRRIMIVASFTLTGGIIAYLLLADLNKAEALGPLMVMGFSLLTVAALWLSMEKKRRDQERNHKEK